MSGNERSKYVAVIPCLNEARTIAELVRAVTRELRTDFEQAGAATIAPDQGSPYVIVVDDGSTDTTGKLAAQAGARVLAHSHVRGKGRALATGLQEARRLGFEKAFVLDGDGQHAPADIQAFLKCAHETGVQLIVGNRMLQAQGMPWVRRVVNRWMSRRLSKLAGRPLPDSQCGFRLIDLKTWSALAISAEHFEIESEMLLAFIAAGAQVEFVPIQVIYKTEQSKIHPWRDTWRWFRWLRRWRSHCPSRQPPEASRTRPQPS
jgi:glycosyltransferase involved in cell wall biosynthesis